MRENHYCRSDEHLKVCDSKKSNNRNKCDKQENCVSVTISRVNSEPLRNFVLSCLSYLCSVCQSFKYAELDLQLPAVIMPYLQFFQVYWCSSFFKFIAIIFRIRLLLTCLQGDSFPSDNVVLCINYVRWPDSGSLETCCGFIFRSLRYDYLVQNEVITRNNYRPPNKA